MAHVHELYDFTASAYIVHKNKILLVHHKKLRVWITPGGHIELDEDPEQALWREIAEETGLQQANLSLLDVQKPINGIESAIEHSGTTFKPLPMPFATFVVDYDVNSKHKHIDLCYLLLSSSEEVSLEHTAAHDIGWFSLPEIQELVAGKHMFENTFHYAAFALKQLANK